MKQEIARRIDEVSTIVQSISLEDALDFDFNSWKTWIRARVKALGKDRFEGDLLIAIQLLKQFISGMGRMYSFESNRFPELNDMPLPCLTMSREPTSYIPGRHIVNINPVDLEELSRYKTHDPLLSVARDNADVTDKGTNLEIFYKCGMEELHHAIDYFRHPEYRAEGRGGTDIQVQHDALGFEIRARATIIAILRQDGVDEDVVKVHMDRLLNGMQMRRERN